MPYLDDDRLRYPNEYIDLLNAAITELRDVDGKPDLKTFVLKSHVGYSIRGQTRIDLTPNIKEGVITSGNAQGIIKFKLPQDGNLSNAEIFLVIEEWKDVVIK